MDIEMPFKKENKINIGFEAREKPISLLIYTMFLATKAGKKLECSDKISIIKMEWFSEDLSVTNYRISYCNAISLNSSLLLIREQV